MFCGLEKMYSKPWARFKSGKKNKYIRSERLNQRKVEKIDLTTTRKFVRMV